MLNIPFPLVRQIWYRPAGLNNLKSNGTQKWPNNFGEDIKIENVHNHRERC